MSTHLSNMIIAFDIDDTLWKIRVIKRAYPEGGGDCVLGCYEDLHECGRYRYDQVPDYDLIQVLRWFYSNGDTIWVWSAGGEDYAQTIVDKLGLNDMVTVVKKETVFDPVVRPDITFDDQEVNLGKVNVRVKRTKK